MGPKVEAACRFATATGRTAAIGSLADLPDIVRGSKGTLINNRFANTTWHGSAPRATDAHKACSVRSKC
jgi:carbamate kinase